nr:VWA domain-containing protein [Desulfobacterales bacterium]
MMPGRRPRSLLDDPTGFYVESRPMNGEVRSNLAIEATIRTAAPYQMQRRRRKSFVIYREDFMEKIKKRKGGYSVLFVVDASSSMRGRKKMVMTKGLIVSLLTEIYQRRDRIGLVAFRHTQSEILLPLTHNIIKARRCLEMLPVGGKTPLAEGMALGLKALLQDRFRNPCAIPLMVIISDGKPNLSMNNDDPLEETLAVADRIRRNRILSIFIDTEDNPLAFGYGPDIAWALDGTYLTLSQIVQKQGSKICTTR